MRDKANDKPVSEAPMMAIVEPAVVDVGDGILDLLE
jgi:hypothetical protein